MLPPDLRWVEEDDGDFIQSSELRMTFIQVTLHNINFTSHNKDNHATIDLTKGGEVVTIHHITKYHITIYHIKVGNQGW